MNAPAALLALLLAQVQVQPAPGELHGVVRGGDGGASAPLPYALVELVGPQRRTAVADEAGRYVLAPVTPGVHRVRALHVGHATVELEVLVPAGGRVQVDLELRREPIALPELTVVGAAPGVPDPDGSGPGGREGTLQATEITLRTLAASPGLAESGVAGAAGSPNGSGDPSEPRDVLLMRGSTADLKLVLLDGAPVYTPFHLGGLLESLDPGAFGGATLHVGGAPARYDGGLSYILDLRTRAPRSDGFHTEGAVDLLGGRVALEGPLGRAGGLLVSGRALHHLEGKLLGGSGSPYGYGDALARWQASPAEGHTLALTAFLNEESVYLDFPGRDGLTLRSAGVEPPDAARWGNRMVSATWDGRAGANDVDVTAAASRYEAELPVRPETAGDPLVLARGRTDRLRVALDVSRAWGPGRLRLGAAADRVDLAYGARRLTGADAPTRETTGGATVVGGYVDASRPVAPGLELRAGLRADHFSAGEVVRLAPRVALAWALERDAVLTLAAGRYHQHTRTSDTDVERTLADAADGTVPDGERLLPVATADHLVLSLDQELTSSVRLGLEGFLKAFRGVGGGDDRLTSSGVDLRVARQGERTTAWLGYSLSWFWAEDRDPGASTTTFTGRHLLSSGVRGQVAGPFGADLRLSFSDGLPYTAVRLDDETAAPVQQAGEDGALAGGDPALGGPAEGFLRLDAEVHALWETRWGGRDVTLRPYVRVLNALDRRDALFWYFQPWRDPEARPLAELSMLPVVGLEWRF